MARTGDERDDRRSKPPLGRFTSFTPLTAPIDQVLMQIKDEGALTFPGKLKGDPNKWPRDRYCRFHRDHSHDTVDYYEAADRSPYLAREVTKVLPQGENRSASSRASLPTGQRASQTTSGRHKDDCGRHGDYRLIQEGLKDLPQNVQMTGIIPKMPRVNNPIIGFSEEDA